MAFNKLANLYNDSGRVKEAEQNYLQAFAIYRQLAGAYPAAYQPDLATTLNSLANLYGKTQRVNQAEQAFREALTIRWGLAKANPEIYQEQVSATLHDWAAMYNAAKIDKPVGMP